LTERIAVPLKALAQRSASLAVLGLAFAIFIVAQSNPGWVVRLRTALADLVVPVVAFVKQPVEFARDVGGQIDSWRDVRNENVRLKAEIEALRQWQERAQTLNAENERLRGLMNAVQETPPSFVTVPVVADAGNVFVRALLIGGGARDGVEKGQTAVASPGLVGRVVEVGQRSARLLLITDLSSRIPVVIERDRTRAVLVGDNTALPKLMYLPPEVQAQVGDRIVTSGDARATPPGIPVGIVTAVGADGVRVQPIADLARLERVVLLDDPLREAVQPKAALP
jgi:rod shape-determining protein MreC